MLLTIIIGYNLITTKEQPPIRAKEGEERKGQERGNKPNLSMKQLLRELMNLKQ